MKVLRSTEVERKSAPQAGPLNRGHSCFADLLLIAVTVAAYFPGLSNSFVGLDDQKTVYENWNLTHLSAGNFYSFWTAPLNDLYTPLTYSLFAVIAFFSRARSTSGHVAEFPFLAWPFHAVSLLLHVLSVVVVYHLLLRLIGDGCVGWAYPPTDFCADKATVGEYAHPTQMKCRTGINWPAMVGALVFALHPVQVETVAWVTAMNGLLCGLLSLSALLLYVKAIAPTGDLGATGGRSHPVRWTHFALASELFIGAILSKPLAVIVPVLALILSWTVSKSRKPWELGIWLIFAFPFAVIGRLSQPIPDWWLVVPMRIRPMVAGDALAFYIWKIIWPVPLTPDYGRSPQSVVDGGWGHFTWIVPVILCVVLMLLYRRGMGRRAIAGAMWFVAALLPVLGFTPFAFQRMSTVADRYLYLPMFGVAMLMSWGLSQLMRNLSGAQTRTRMLSKYRSLSCCVIVLAFYAICTSRQIRYWHDKQTLFQHSIEVIGREPGVREGS